MAVTFYLKNNSTYTNSYKVTLYNSDTEVENEQTITRSSYVSYTGYDRLYFSTVLSNYSLAGDCTYPIYIGKYENHTDYPQWKMLFNASGTYVGPSGGLVDAGGNYYITATQTTYYARVKVYNDGGTELYNKKKSSTSRQISFTLPSAPTSELHPYAGSFNYFRTTSSYTTDKTVSGGGTATISATTSGNLTVTYNANFSYTTYTIGYNANGGTGAPHSQTKYRGEALTLRSESPTWASHTFEGWALSSSASVATYQPGDSFTLNGNYTLYAVWTYIPPVISKFYWCSDSSYTEAQKDAWDISNIASGQNITNLTAYAFNRLQNAIHDRNASFVVQLVSQDALITANDFNRVRTGLLGISGISQSDLPSAVTECDTIYASYFQGNTSLKSAFNKGL